MEPNLRPLAFGIATAITFALLSALCALGFAFWPDATLGFFAAFMHGLDLTAVKSLAPLSLARVTYGVVGLGIVGLLTGAVLGALRDKPKGAALKRAVLDRPCARRRV